MQKTAYEMRISDWSSDVCSSDLITWETVPRRRTASSKLVHCLLVSNGLAAITALRSRTNCRAGNVPVPASGASGIESVGAGIKVHAGCGSHASTSDWRKRAKISSSRSEEHTSELQSLMRISYAVFCLKKKKQQ